MSIRNLITEPDSILRKKSEPLHQVNNDTQKLLDDMLKTMYADHHLIKKKSDDKIVLNNGCLCCSFSGDLVKTLDDTLNLKSKFDRIIIETSGLADPIPIVQTIISDQIISGKIKFKTNHAGGILGGISSGQDIVASFAVKPTSSILTSRETIDKKGKNTNISVKGRHDPCVGIRAVPIGEAMINCVLLDHLLMHRAQCG